MLRSVGSAEGLAEDGAIEGLAVGALVCSTTGASVGVLDGSHVGGADLFGHVGTTGGALLCGLQILCFVGLRVGTVVGSLVGATV